MSESRKLAAILVADVVGYSRLAGADEDRTLARLRGLRSDLIEPAIAAHHGRLDQAEDYVNERLTACGEYWQLDAETRLMLGLPTKGSANPR
jgi:hypothetical protein